MSRSSMAPVKDWISKMPRLVQNHIHGVEKTNKNYERESVAK